MSTKKQINEKSPLFKDGRMSGEENSKTEFTIRPGDFVLPQKHCLQTVGLWRNGAETD